MRFRQMRFRQMRFIYFSIVGLLIALLFIGFIGSVADARGNGLCYADANCQGRVLSHRDAHNCKVKSRGKSWQKDRNSQCYRL